MYEQKEQHDCSSGKWVHKPIQNDLPKQNQNIVYEEDADEAYEAFLNEYNSQYHKKLSNQIFQKEASRESVDK